MATYTYQWRRCNTSGGACSNIVGATSQNYVLQAADVGSTIRVVVSDGVTTVTSNATEVVGQAPTPPVPGQPPPVQSGNRFVWTLGDPTWSLNQQLYGTNTPGWAYNFSNWNGSTSSTGWERDASGEGSITPQRIYFDDSAFPNLMTTISGSYGQRGLVGPASGVCRTVAVRIDASDPAVPGITNTAQGSVLRLPHDGSVNPDYGSRPSVHPLQGQEWWFGYSFATNPAYKPHGWDGSDLTWGNYNGCGLELHGAYPYSILGPILPNISTIWPTNPVERNAGPNGSTWWKRLGNASSFIGAAHLGVELTGGDNAVGTTDNGTNTCRGFVGPTLVTGQVYKVRYRVIFDAFQNGLFQWWVDSGSGYVLYADQSSVSTLWRIGSTTDPYVYPQMLNYRKYDNTLPSSIFYYAGFVRGTQQSDVNIP